MLSRCRDGKRWECQRVCDQTGVGGLLPCLSPFLSFSFLLFFTEDPFIYLLTKAKGPVERGKPKMEEVGAGGEMTMVLRPGRGLDTLRRTGSLQLLTSIFAAKSKASPGTGGTGGLLRESEGTDQGLGRCVVPRRSQGFKTITPPLIAAKKGAVAWTRSQGSAGQRRSRGTRGTSETRW